MCDRMSMFDVPDAAWSAGKDAGIPSMAIDAAKAHFFDMPTDLASGMKMANDAGIPQLAKEHLGIAVPGFGRRLSGTDFDPMMTCGTGCNRVANFDIPDLAGGI